MSSIISTVALLGSLAASVNAHGYVSGIVAGGQYSQGFDPAFTYQPNPPVVVGWTEMNRDNGYVSDYTSPDIICHKEATPAGTSAKINGGDKLDFQWNTWPESHHGPVITYLAKCDGKCEDADKNTLKWFKIDEAAQVDKSSVPGTWATDDLIANNNTYSVTIPDSIAAGNYVARHEIIALHSAGQEGGAQNYPYCINLEIASTGSDQPEGVVGTALYTSSDPGITVNIYAELDYQIPGPALYTGGSSGSAPAASSAAASSPAASSAPATTTPAVNTQVVSTSSAAVASATAEVTDYQTATTAVTVTGSAPTASATASSGNGSVAAPSKPLPEGTTIDDLLSWVNELFEAQSASSKAKAKRSHPRAFRV